MHGPYILRLIADHNSSLTDVARHPGSVLAYLIVPEIWKGLGVYLCLRALVPDAGVAQLVEHLICNQRVVGSNPIASSSMRNSETNFPAGSRTR